MGHGVITSSGVTETLLVEPVESKADRVNRRGEGITFSLSRANHDVNGSALTASQ
jgi:hypothetical protein